MSRGFSLMLLGVAASLFPLSGCGEDAPAGIPHTHNPHAELTLCGLCGDIKDTAACCKEGTALCAVCGLHKDSVLCCSSAIDGRRDRVLCRKCGEVAFTKKCCKEGVAACPKCGMHKASPGCCKIDPVPKDAAGSEYEHAHAAGH